MASAMDSDTWLCAHLVREQPRAVADPCLADNRRRDRDHKRIDNLRAFSVPGTLGASAFVLLFLLSLTLSSRFPPAMSDTPPLRDFLQAVFARIKAGGTGDSELAVWRNTARELVDRTIGVGPGDVAHAVG